MTILTTETKIKLDSYKDKLFEVMPNDERVHTDTEEEGPLKYTDSEWVDEITKRYFVSLIKRGNEILIKKSLALDEVNLE